MGTRDSPERSERCANNEVILRVQIPVIYLWGHGDLNPDQPLAPILLQHEYRRTILRRYLSRELNAVKFPQRSCFSIKSFFKRFAGGGHTSQVVLYPL